MSKGKQVDNWSEIGLGEDKETNIPVTSNINREDIIDKPINNNNDVDNNVDNNVDNKNSSEKERNNDMISAIDKVIDTALATKKEKEKPVFHGIYFEPDVSAAINRIAKKGGKGVKSKMINDIVKVALEQKGLL